MHGAFAGAPKGSRGAVKHSVYAEVLSPANQALLARMDGGSLREEIKVLKVRLHRAIAAQEKLDAALNANGEDETTDMTVVGIEETTGENEQFGRFDETKRTKKRPDYHAIIDRLTGRIGKLVQIQAQLDEMDKTADNGTLDALFARLDDSRRRHGMG